jgi:hypothetical protein
LTMYLRLIGLAGKLLRGEVKASETLPPTGEVTTNTRCSTGTARGRHRSGRKRHMKSDHPRLKLGKRASFVKTHLKRLQQEAETWEADFRALPRPPEQPETHYLGLAVALPRGDPLVYLPVEYTPTVNDLADLLAEAMRRPLTGSDRRPEYIHMRSNPRWEELFPHLKELGIEVTLHGELPELEEVYLDFCRQMRGAGSGRIIMLSPRLPAFEERFPVLSKWVLESGWIEVGRQQNSGFVVRALDDGGPVFEDDKPDTLAEAMAALEMGLKKWFDEQGTDLG